MIKDRKFWLCAFYSFLIFVNIQVLTNVWRIDYLEQVYQLSRYQATIDNGFTIIGFVIGAPCLGLLAKHLKITSLMLVGASFQFLFLFISVYLVSDLSVKLFFYLLLGFFSSSFVFVGLTGELLTLFNNSYQLAIAPVVFCSFLAMVVAFFLRRFCKDI